MIGHLHSRLWRRYLGSLRRSETPNKSESKFEPAFELDDCGMVGAQPRLSLQSGTL
jgi:hypothetical protein